MIRSFIKYVSHVYAWSTFVDTFSTIFGWKIEMTSIAPDTKKRTNLTFTCESNSSADISSANYNLGYLDLSCTMKSMEYELRMEKMTNEWKEDEHFDFLSRHFHQTNWTVVMFFLFSFIRLNEIELNFSYEKSVWFLIDSIETTIRSHSNCIRLFVIYFECSDQFASMLS